MEETPDHRTCVRCRQMQPLCEFTSAADPSALTRNCGTCRARSRTYTARYHATRRGRRTRKAQKRRWLVSFPGWIYRTWHHMRLRCGYLGTAAMHARHRQFNAYHHVTLDLSKDEFYAWAYSQRVVWETLVAEGEKPSIDRVDPAKGYAVGNIRIVDLRSNIAAGASSSARLNNPKRRKSA